MTRLGGPAGGGILVLTSAMLATTLAGCQAARALELEKDMTELSEEIAELTKMVEILEKGITRARNHVLPSGLDQTPEGFDLDRPLPKGHPSKPDVILLSIDTLRADHLGAYGYERDTSPFFDELAATGTRYADAWSPAPWTLPSHTTMLTGRLTPNHLAIEDHIRISDDIPMLQESFSNAGYATAGVVATLFVSRKYGFERGFDYFEDFDIQGAAANNASTVDAEHVFNNMLHWAQDLEDGEPVFAFLHSYDVHFGYNPPEPWNTKFDRAPRVGDAIYKSYTDYKKKMVSAEQLAHQVAQYDEEIAYVDAMFRILVEKWRNAGRKVIVAVTADHGEEFGERGSWGHAHTLWSEQLHVPLIVNGPGVRTQVVQQRVGTEDIAPTLAGMAGVAFKAEDGVDRSTQLRGGGVVPSATPPAQFAETTRFETLKYRWHAPPYDLTIDLARDNRHLCNIKSDPGCTKNLYRDQADVGEKLTTELFAYLGEPWEARANGTIEVRAGFIYDGVERHKKTMPVAEGQTFSVHPGDAKVKWTEQIDAEDAEPEFEGPWQALGGDLPEDDASLAYTGKRIVDASITHTDDEKALLEELGYLMGDDEDEDDFDDEDEGAEDDAEQ